MGSINFLLLQYFRVLLALAILSHFLWHCCFGSWTKEFRGHPFDCFQVRFWVKLAFSCKSKLAFFCPYVCMLFCVLIYFYRVAGGTVRHIDRWEVKHLSLALVTITLWSDAQSGIAELCQLIAPTFVFISSNSIMWCTTSLFFY